MNKDFVDLQSIANDSAWWDRLGEKVKPAARRHFERAALAGVEMALDAIREAQKADDPISIFAAPSSELPQILAAVVEQYTDAWWEELSQVRRKRLQELILQAFEEGRQPIWVARRLEESGLFSKVSAEMVAVTETTRLIGLGSQATYRAQGFGTWAWLTARDDLVCPICGPLHNQEFDINVSFAPAHPRCRCWAAPGQMTLLAMPQAFADVA